MAAGRGLTKLDPGCTRGLAGGISGRCHGSWTTNRLCSGNKGRGRGAKHPGAEA